MFVRFYTEWSVNSPIAVKDQVSGKRYWFSQLDKERQTEALSLPKFDINRGRFVQMRKAR